MNAPDHELDDLRILAEQSRKVLGNQPGEQKHDRRKGKTQSKSPAYRFFDAGAGTGAVIVADNGLRPAGDAAHGGGDQHHIALHNGSAGNEKIALARTSEPLKNGVHDNNHDTVGGQN